MILGIWQTLFLPGVEVWRVRPVPRNLSGYGGGRQQFNNEENCGADAGGESYHQSTYQFGMMAAGSLEKKRKSHCVSGCQALPTIRAAVC